jgi:hypothetical protein
MELWEHNKVLWGLWRIKLFSSLLLVTLSDESFILCVERSHFVQSFSVLEEIKASASNLIGTAILEFSKSSWDGFHGKQLQIFSCVVALSTWWIGKRGSSWVSKKEN